MTSTKELTPAETRPAKRPPAATIEVRSPVDDSVVSTFHEFTAVEADAVIARLRAARSGWAATPVDERSRLLVAAADALAADADRLADLLVREVAKARKDARDEVVRSADFLRYTAEEARRVVGDAQFSDSFVGQARNKLAVSHRVPLGLVLAIPPFNYPINLSISKVGPALAAGNVVLLKPPTQGSIAATAMVEVLHAAGVPTDVLAVVTGRGSRIGDHLVRHRGVDMINFTGSSETGRSVAKQAGMVPLLLELGGKDAAVVLDDADLDAAADDIVSGAFSYAGQRCTAVKRVLVVEGVADALVDRLRERIGRLTVGDPRDNCTVTPLVDPTAAARTTQLVEHAVERGARLLAGGGSEGNLFQPTLLDHVTVDMDLAWVEPFAPVLPVIRVRSAAEAVEVANASEYGLQAAVFTSNLDMAMAVAQQLDVGTVQINGRTARGPDHFPFIGTKSSGMGAQGVRYSIEAMTRLKATVFNMSAPDLHRRTGRRATS